MNNKTIILLLAIVNSIMISCKTQNSLSEKIEGKWQIEKVFHKSRLLTMEDTLSTLGDRHYTMDFRHDGKIYFNYAGHGYQLPYSIKGDSILKMGEETYTVTYLGNNYIKLYYKKVDKDTPVVFEETSYSLKR